MLLTRIINSVFVVGVVGIYISSSAHAFLMPVPGYQGLLPGEVENFLRVKSAQSPFIKNAGQADSRISFYRSTATGIALVTTSGELLYTINQQASKSVKQKTSSFRVQFKGGKANPVGIAKYNPLVNFYLGNEIRRSLPQLPIYNTVKLGEVWPGINVSLHSREARVGKYFTVQPGSDVSSIQMRIANAQSLKIENNGRLEVSTTSGAVRFSQPNAYQYRNGQKVYVPIAYQIDHFTYGFAVKHYDQSKALFIDPLMMVKDEASS